MRRKILSLYQRTQCIIGNSYDQLYFRKLETWKERVDSWTCNLPELYQKTQQTNEHQDLISNEHYPVQENPVSDEFLVDSTKPKLFLNCAKELNSAGPKNSFFE